MMNKIVERWDSCGPRQYLTIAMVAFLGLVLGMSAYFSLWGIVRKPDIVTNVEMRILDNPAVRDPGGRRYFRTWRRWDASETCDVTVGRVLIAVISPIEGSIYAPWTMLDVPATGGLLGHHEVVRRIEIPDWVPAGDYLYATIDPHTNCEPSGNSQTVRIPPLPVTLGE